MTELALSRRRELKALAHALKPVVWIGASGLSEGVIHELDQALKSHELIKIKVSSDEREKRNLLLEQICNRMEAAPVQHIGKILVIYRPEPDNTAGAAGDLIPVRNRRKSPAPRIEPAPRKRNVKR
ncbi:MAG: ribosome assembly RNA-binding protein YhbY [Nitrosospira sp.]|nr:ribosome assembly RNA-binding protein YhbY [Nitrosospira sp.]